MTTESGYYYKVVAVGQDRASQNAHNEAFDALFTIKPPTDAQYRRARALGTRQARRRALRVLADRRYRRRRLKR
jgi:hypothetical protein